MRKIWVLLTALLLLGLLTLPVSAELKIVSTTTVIADPLESIGGDKVSVVTISDASNCPHMQGDVVSNVIQLKQDYIQHADLFVCHNNSMDGSIVWSVDRFMRANNFGNITWLTLKDPDADWNTPAAAIQLATEEKGWLETADPENTNYYETRYTDYIQKIAAANLTDEEKQTISGQDVIVMYWQQNAARDWLGLDVVSVFASEYYDNGNYSPARIVDDINAQPEKYRNVTYVIENMQAGEMAKGIEEALHAKGINATRVVFTNFPKSVNGVDSIPEVLAYNKGLVTPNGSAAAVPAAATQSPLGTGVIIAGICMAGAVLCLCRH